MTTNTTPTKTYYLTRYALSDKGRIQAFTGEVHSEGEYVSYPKAFYWTLFKLGRDVHETSEAAIAAAEAARTKKIASLKRQIAVLEKLAFTIEESK